jgi:hypothetical protein
LDRKTGSWDSQTSHSPGPTVVFNLNIDDVDK